MPVFAVEPDAMLYELTENMQMHGKHRLATSALGGFASPKTPLCPEPLVSAAGRCVLNATGSNNINLATGQGPVQGDFAIVTQDTNPLDIEEQVRLRGNFRGHMDLSSAGVTFLGTMDGHMTVQRGRGNAPFRGIVRFPIPCGEQYCYVTSDSDAKPTGFVPLELHEFALGRPTVRLDIYFQ